MTKLLTGTLGILLSLIVSTTTLAEEDRLVGVVSAKSYNGLIRAVTDIGEQLGQPGLDKQTEMQLEIMTSGKGLAGFDKSRPIGSAFYFDKDDQFHFLAFLPVNDFDALLSLLPEEAGIRELEDGVREFPTPIPFSDFSLYLKHHNKWLFISMDQDRLANLPADPTKLLGDLPKKYDLAGRFHAQNLPKSVWKSLIDEIDREIKYAKRQASRKTEIIITDEEDETKVAYEKLIAAERKCEVASLQELSKLVSQLFSKTDTIELGLAVEKKSKNFVYDLTMTAMPNSSLATDLARFKTRPHRFSGFLIPDACYASLFSLTGKPSAGHLTMVQVLRKHLITSIENSLVIGQRKGSLSKESRKILTTSLTSLADSLFQTYTQGNVDVGTVLITDPEPTLVIGSTLTNVDAVEKSLKDLADTLKSELLKDIEGLPEIQWNSGKLLGYRLHRVNLPVDDEDAAKILGEEIEFILAVGEDSLFLAAGSHPETTLKTILTQSQTGKDKSHPPGTASMSTTSFLKLVSSVESELIADILNDQIDILKGKDGVHGTLREIPNGIQLKYTIEPGYFKILGLIIELQNQMLEDDTIYEDEEEIFEDGDIDEDF